MEDQLILFFWIGTFLMSSLVTVVIILVIIYQKNLHMYRYDQLEKQLLNNIEVELKERERIAKELHDGLCADLATLKNFAYVLELSQDIELQKRIILDIKQSALECYTQAQRISRNLSPSVIQNNTIAPLLESYLTKLARATSIVLTFKSNEPTFCFNEIVRLELFRIVQEIIQNIHKHSQATYATVELDWTKDRLVMSIRDNGIFYDFTSQHRSRCIGLGLHNIKSRLDRIKANFIHESKQNSNMIQLILLQDHVN